MEGYKFDYRLGYIREGCAKEGFDVIGSGAKRIVVLGGYTTPEMAKSGRSWAHALHRQLGEEWQVLSGCTDGYSSAQILTLFIRDGILFEPEAVICLSGFYNIAYKLGLIQNKADAALLSTHPFATPVQLQFLREITSVFGLGKDDVFYGEDNHFPAWEFWLRQMSEIKCLCDEFGIKFKSFLQPCVFSGAYWRNERENTLLCEYYGIAGDEIETFGTLFQREYVKIAEGAKESDYIINLAGAMDGCEDVYSDACHVKDECMHILMEKML